MAEKKWIGLCVLGGILMALSGTVGSVGFIGTIINALNSFFGNPTLAKILEPIFWIFTLIALGGGISVIIGCIIYNGGREGTGKFIIGIGAGMGLFGLIISIISSIIAGTSIQDLMLIVIDILNGSLGFVGVLLTIIARIKM